MVVLKRVRDNGIYLLQRKAIDASSDAMVTTLDSMTNLWHRRLGHIIEKGLSELVK